ncbi:MAG TPA: 2-oxo acid dehydrogenase subunit E2 [Mycobacterium sp.]|jgi:pyruvate dehydrogenase E2 component (dihydrolipoamide acetyltransferase)|nr:2-oxo acid dehydrogenase subunit E2 [Mycobacterium sp.]
MPALLRMPAIAAGADSAVLAEWQVQLDVPFGKSDPIATVETDKAAVEIEAEESGVILRFLVASGEQVEVGAPIALSCVPGEVVDDIDAALRELGVAAIAGSGSNGSHSAPVATAAPEATIAPATGGGEPGRLFATPLVRRLAESAELDLSTVTGTGPNGRIVRRDIEAVLAAPTAPQASEIPTEKIEPATSIPVAASSAAGTHTGATFTDVPLTRMRAAIAARLTESKRTAPHFYLRGSCRVDKLLALRAELNADLSKTDKVKVSVNDLVVKAAARAHTLVPEMNVLWTEHAIRRFDTVDIAVAVASQIGTQGGLITPVVRNVGRSSVTAVSRALGDLTARARDGKLTQPEIEGGSFCVSNLGMYGTEEFSAIINPPQSAILAVGAARSEPVVQDGELAVATVMRVTLSVDHRPIDGSTAAEWMSAFIDTVENPLQILL